MNPERPTDPREQMEVRITALLLGEASAFEEAELLDAIKQNPQLASYYDEMRRMVNQIEATVQSAPLETVAERPRLTDEKRAKLEVLFKQPAARTIPLESTARRVRRRVWLQQVAAIAAAFVILAIAIGMFIPAGGAAKGKARFARLEVESAGEHTDFMSRPQEPSFTNGMLNSGALQSPSPIEKDAGRDDARRQINAALVRGEAALEKFSSTPTAPKEGPRPGNGGGDAPEVQIDERFLLRYGTSQSKDRSSRRRVTAQVETEAPVPAKPAAIYLPSADKEAGAINSYAAVVTPPQQAGAAGQPMTSNFRSAAPTAGRPLSLHAQDDGVVAVPLDSPAITFSVPTVRNQAMPTPAALPISSPPQPTPALGLAKLADSVEMKSVIIVGSTLPSIQSAQAADRTGEEMDRLGAVSGKADNSQRGWASSDALSVEAKDRVQMNGAAKPNADRYYFAQAGETATAGVPINQPAPTADNVVIAQDIARTGLESVAKLPHNQLALGRKKLSQQAAAMSAGGAVGRPAIEAGVNQFSEFASAQPVPAAVDFGNVRAAQDGDINGRRDGFELFAKVPAGPTIGDSLNWAAPSAAGAKDPKLAFRYRGLNEQASADLATEREDVARREKVEAFDVESKRQAGDREIVLLEEREDSIRLGKQPDARSETRMFRVSPTVVANDMDGVFASSLGGKAGGGGGGGIADLANASRAANGSIFAQASLAPGGGAVPGQSGDGGGGIRFLTATNHMSGVNTAMLDYLKKEAGVELGAPSAMYYNDRTGMLMVKAPLEQLELVQQAVEKLNRQPDPASAPATALSRFDALSDVDPGDRTAEGLLGETRLNGLADISKSDVADKIAPVELAVVTKRVDYSVVAEPATPPPPSLEPLPEISTKANAFSTFSLNVSDVSFQLAASSLENGQMPDGARLRSEEFINAFDYRDPMPAPGQRVAFNWERARNPFAHNRELLRFSVQTAAAGREPGQPLNLVLLLDNSGSMERADRVQITEQMLRVLAAQLTGYDRVSFITFARTPRLIVDGAKGGNPEALLKQVIGLNPDGGTNLEDAMKLAYETAAKHFLANGNNRVILITDGAANLGNVDPAQLRERVIDQRKRGIALDCFGVGWEGFNDNLLESLSRNGDGRYGFLNDAETAPTQFASQLAGALQVAASDVKAQIEFNPNRVTVYRQIGYQQHQLTKEQFRDNTVDAAEIGAAEAGNALYSVEVNPNGSGPIGTFRVRYRVPSTGLYEEKEWVLDYTPNSMDLEKSAPAMRLASTSAAFAEWLANSPYAQTVTPDALQNLLRGVPEVYAPDPRPTKLQTMIQQARVIGGR